MDKEEKSLPKPESELPLPEEEITEKSTSTSQSEALESTTQKQTSTEKPKRKLPLPKILVAGIVILITLLAFGLIAYLMMDQNKTQTITSYEDCVAAGYPIQETYPEKCTVPGTASFTRELTTDEIEKLNPGIYEGNEFSFEYPTGTFALAHLVCNNHSQSSPMLVEKSSNNKYSNVGCVHGIKFDIRKVEKVNDLLDDPSCYSINKEQITIDNNPATSYTTEFIGGDVDKCTKGLMGKYSLEEKYIYFENGNQLYLIWWPIDEAINQNAYDQILSTFKFTDQASSADEASSVDTSDWKTYTNNEFGYSIKYPPDMNTDCKTDSDYCTFDRFVGPGGGPTSFIWFTAIPIDKSLRKENAYNDDGIDKLVDEENNSKVIPHPNNPEIDKYFTLTRLEDINLDGQNAFVFENKSPWEFPEGTVERRAIFVKNNIIYTLGAYTESNVISLNEFNQILSTLKFTE